MASRRNRQHDYDMLKPQEWMCLSLGLWVNKRYPHLGATPDCITSDGGIIEIKCLKVLKENSDEDIARGMKVPRLETNSVLLYMMANWF